MKSDKKIQDLRERIASMSDRMKFFSKSTGVSFTKSSTRPLSPSSPQKKNASRRMLMSMSPKSPSSLPSSETRLDEYGNNNDESSNADVVPVEMYQMLEQTVKKLNKQLAAKENALTQKDEVVEVQQSLQA
jgi:hypothetical protein